MFSTKASNNAPAPITKMPVEIKDSIYNYLILSNQAQPISALNFQASSKGMRTAGSSQDLALIKEFNKAPSTALKFTKDPRLSIRKSATFYSKVHELSQLRDGKLSSMVKDIRHQFHEPAKVLIGQKLDNNTYAPYSTPSVNLSCALELIPVLGDKAKKFVNRNFNQLRDSQLSSMVKDIRHQFHEPAKVLIGQKLDNNTYAPYSTPSVNVSCALELIPVLGDKAKNFVTRSQSQE
tara:strand:- start:329 stop:1036 length:708 start_codon:yes stop_codon:yes gene_type:complete